MSLRLKCPYAEMQPYDCRWTGELNDLMKVRKAKVLLREYIIIINNNYLTGEFDTSIKMMNKI